MFPRVFKPAVPQKQQKAPPRRILVNYDDPSLLEDEKGIEQSLLEVASARSGGEPLESLTFTTPKSPVKARSFFETNDPETTTSFTVKRLNDLIGKVNKGF
jgi:hypothetical protein